MEFRQFVVPPVGVVANVLPMAKRATMLVEHLKTLAVNRRVGGKPMVVNRK